MNLLLNSTSTFIHGSALYFLLEIPIFKSWIILGQKKEWPGAGVVRESPRSRVALNGAGRWEEEAVSATYLKLANLKSWEGKEGMGCIMRRPKLNWHSCGLAGWPWMNALLFANLSFIVSKTEVSMISTSYQKICVKVLCHLGGTPTQMVVVVVVTNDG